MAAGKALKEELVALEAALEAAENLLQVARRPETAQKLTGLEPTASGSWSVAPVAEI